MEEIKFFCNECCLKFDNNIWYDLHFSLVHGYESKTNYIKEEPNSAGIFF